STGLQNLLNTLNEADGQLYGPDASSGLRSAKAFRSGLVASVKMLSDPNDVGTLRSKYEPVGDSIAALEKANAQASGSLDKIGGALKGVEWAKDEECKNFQRYTENTLTTFAGDAKPLITNRQKVVTDFRTLYDRVGDFLMDHPTNDNLIRVTNVVLPAGSVKDVTVTVRQQTVVAKDDALTVTAGADTKVSLRVREYQAYVVEF